MMLIFLENKVLLNVLIAGKINIHMIVKKRWREVCGAGIVFNLKMVNGFIIYWIKGCCKFCGIVRLSYQSNSTLV